MSNDVENWLVDLGLDRYVEAFAANDIDTRALPYLTNEDRFMNDNSCGPPAYVCGPHSVNSGGKARTASIRAG